MTFAEVANTALPDIKNGSSLIIKSRSKQTTNDLNKKVRI